jgi:hypothetical protein
VVSGRLNFSVVEVQQQGQLIITESGSSLGSTTGSYSFNSMAVRAFGTMTAQYMDLSTANATGVRIVISSETVSVDANGTISSDGFGFAGTSSVATVSVVGAGMFDSQGGSGGGHGGAGGDAG